MTAARTPHKHATEIHAFAEGFEIEFMPPGAEKWLPVTDPSFDVQLKYRIKPEKVYPVTQMDSKALYEVWCAPAVPIGALTNVANAALRHAVDADQVVPMAEVQEVARNLNKSMHAKHVRDTAEAVFLACHAVVARHSGATANHLRKGVDIDKILAKEPS